MATTSTEYDDTNRGSLFRNKKKNSDRHPDYTGTLNVGGVEFWISAWSKFSPKLGENLLSISVTPKEARPSEGGADPLAPTPVAGEAGNAAPAVKEPGYNMDDMDGDAPFN